MQRKEMRSVEKVSTEKAKELEKLKELCTPVMKYLRSNSDPYTEICISEDGIKVKQIIVGISNEKSTNIERR